MGVTIKQIAQEVGLSWPAVSQILNGRGRFAADTRKRVLAVAASHDYRPNSAARSLREKSSRTVGVLLRNDATHTLTNVDAFEYVLGINQQFQSADYGTLLIRAGEFAGVGQIQPRVFREHLVDGVIVIGDLPGALIEQVRADSQRVIWLDAPVWEPTCCIRRDEFASGYECVSVLANLGYRRVMFIARGEGRRGHHSHMSREAGARAAAKAQRVEFEVLNWPEGESTEEYEAMCRLRTREVGFVVSSMPVARRIAHGLASLGCTPGNDYGMVCCDDSFPTQVGWPTLGRVHFDRFSLGQQAGQMMLELLAKPDAPPPSAEVKGSWNIGASAWGPLEPAPTTRPVGRRKASKVAS